MTEEETQDQVEALALLEMSKQGIAPTEEEKLNIFAFFKRVMDIDDSSRASNLDKDELGFCSIPVRTNQELANHCMLMNMNGISDHFIREAQITLATSLGKDGFLIRQAVTQTKQLETKRKMMTSNKGWFKKKGSEQPQQQ